MAALKRKKFEGTLNILRFNWHFFALAAGCVFLLFVSLWFLPPDFAIFIKVLIAGISFSTVLSVAASWYIYDRSTLYTLNWLGAKPNNAEGGILNLHAGFDETSFLLAEKYPNTNLQVFDFYDPDRHTEISIKRARKAAKIYPGTKTITTTNFPAQPGSAALIFTILAAHEIRDTRERIDFFTKLRESLRPDGQVIVVEHLRDLANFLVYNLGAFHFLPKSEWKKTFTSAGLTIEREIKITVFITVFFLQKNGSSS